MQFILCPEDIDMSFQGTQLFYFYKQNIPYHSKYIVSLGKLEEKYSDIPFVAIDIEEFGTQCKRFSITTLPSFLLFKEEKEVKRINGYTSTYNLAQLFTTEEK